LQGYLSSVKYPLDFLRNERINSFFQGGEEMGISLVKSGKSSWVIPMLALLFAFMLGLSGCGGSNGTSSGGTGAGISGSGK